MGKRKGEIPKFEDRAKRQVTISEAGNAFAFGNPAIESVVQSYKTAKKEKESSEKGDDIQAINIDDDGDDQGTDEDDDDGDQQRVQEQYLLEDYESEDDDQKKSDEMDLTLSLSLPWIKNEVPWIKNEEKEDENSGVLIKQKSKSEKGLAINLSAGGMEKNNSNQEEQYKKSPAAAGHSISDLKMMPSLRDVPVKNLELHEIEQLMAQIEEMEKKVLNRVNQIKKTSADSSGDCNEDWD